MDSTVPLGFLTLVLHAHLPFVRHPEFDDPLEEDWLFEAMLETYLPLLHLFSDWDRDGIDWRVTLSISPPLAAMLADPMLQSRFLRHLDNLIELTAKELVRLRWQPEMQRIAELYINRFTRARDRFLHVDGMNLLNGFRHFADTGRLELMTCAATHGYLPLMNRHRPVIDAQVELGASEFARHFGRRPTGIWLPECGYEPGIDEAVARAGLRYFFVETHGILHAEPRPRFGVYAPLRCPSGVFAFGRDTESSRQVWSSVEGYPGDPWYRDFYRDVGFDLDWDYVRPHLHSLGIRHFTGLKYYRITGEEEKQIYDPDEALQRVQSHAEHFLFQRSLQAAWLSKQMNGRPPIIVAPYDAELFGHWWFEGPEFIDALVRRIAANPTTVKLLTIPEYLARHPEIQNGQPSASSWGMNGYSEVWLNPTNDWIYPHLHEIAQRMTELAHRFQEPTVLQERALNQAAREMLLAQSSDWAFMMKTGATVEYARHRTRLHVSNFLDLFEQLSSGNLDESHLHELESRQNIFPQIDFRLFR